MTLAVETRPAWVLLAIEARARGFRDTRGFRRWCDRMGVPRRKTGKKEWVRPCDIDAAVASGAPSAPNREVSAEVDDFIWKRRRG